VPRSSAESAFDDLVDAPAEIIPGMNRDEQVVLLSGNAENVFRRNDA
jgi:predicted TIM-barrel fold metal-dependent hydrolase